MVAYKEVVVEIPSVTYIRDSCSVTPFFLLKWKFSKSKIVTHLSVICQLYILCILQSTIIYHRPFYFSLFLRLLHDKICLTNPCHRNYSTVNVALDCLHLLTRRTFGSLSSKVRLPCRPCFRNVVLIRPGDLFGILPITPTGELSNNILVTENKTLLFGDCLLNILD